MPAALARMPLSTMYMYRTKSNILIENATSLSSGFSHARGFSALWRLNWNEGRGLTPRDNLCQGRVEHDRLRKA